MSDPYNPIQIQPTQGKSRGFLWIVVTIVIGLVVLGLVIGLGIYFRNKKDTPIPPKPIIGPTGPRGNTGPTGPIIDCSLSEWSEWSTCVNDYQTRTRTVLVPPQNGGATCQNLIETRFCGPVDCSLSEWTYEPCIDGSQNGTRTILVQPQNGGAPCGDLSGVFSCVVPNTYLSLNSYNNSILGPAYLSIRVIQGNGYLVATMLPTETNSAFKLTSTGALRYNNQFVNMNRNTGVLSFTNTSGSDTIFLDKVSDVANRLIIGDINQATSSSLSYLGSRLRPLILIDTIPIECRICVGVNPTDPSFIFVSQNSNLNSRAKPLYFTIPNSNPPKYLETVNNETNLTEFCQIENGLYNNDTIYYVDLPTNYVIKNNCYISFRGNNTTNVVVTESCSPNPNISDLKYNTDTKYITLQSRFTNSTDSSPTRYNILHDINSTTSYYTNKLVLNSSTGTAFDIINNPPLTKYIEIVTTSSPLRYLAIKTIDNNDYFYLSSTPVQKFYWLSEPNAFMVLKDNQYKYIELVVNSLTDSYTIKYTLFKPQKGISTYKYYLSYISKRIQSFLGNDCFGRKTIVGLGDQEILTWFFCDITTPNVLVDFDLQQK
jgi:hypothetical protein